MAGKEADRDFKNCASHEINTPLTTIKGTLQLLQRKGLEVDAELSKRAWKPRCGRCNGWKSSAKIC
jgi:signal transduction histidine kinase